jgi:hypothetical protein
MSRIFLFAMKTKITVLFLLSVLFSVPLRAANGITPSTITLTPTFECIGVAANYTGDDNSNATFQVSYRVNGGSTWKETYFPFIDRRTNVGGFANAYLRQARVSIVGLTTNTTYNIRTIWTDSNGGSATATNNATTLAYAGAQTTNGVTKFVDASQGSEGSGTSGSPYKTITNFLANASAGDTAVVSNGNYVAFTWTKSGAANNWIVVKKAAGQTPNISGGAVNQNILMQAHHVVLDGFTFSAAQKFNIQNDSTAHDVFIQNCTFDTSISVPGDDAGIIHVLNVTNIYILTNYLANLTGWEPGTNTHAICFGDGGIADTVVMSDNTITNCGWDSIGGSGKYGHDNGMHNCDISRNVIRNGGDDGIEADGAGYNVRIWGNVVSRKSGLVHNSNGQEEGSCISIAPIYYGPTYVFRNVCSYTNATVLKCGNASEGPCFIFHNLLSSYNSTVCCIDASGEDGGAPNSLCNIFRNNIMEAKGNTIYLTGPGATNSFDYDIHRSAAGTVVYHWNYPATTDYATVAAFRTGTGQEAHGLDGDALVSSYLTGAIPDNSPAINKGVVLTNFNDSTSAWPFNSTAPDMGPLENGTAVPTVPSAPQNLSGTAGNAQVTLNWTAPADSGSSAITAYKVYRSTSTGTETLYQTLGVVLSYIDTGVSNGTQYFYKVSAVNSVGESALSSEANATPAAPPPTVVVLNAIGFGQ